ncbi:hypothetical protein B0A49_08705, partial [Cryomyces minteri]
EYEFLLDQSAALLRRKDLLALLAVPTRFDAISFNDPAAEKWNHAGDSNQIKEVGNVIHLLTQSSPSIQRETIEKYFTYDASFTHPFCRTGSYSAFGGSRVLIRVIYRWYKIMSPRIDMKIHSIAFDQRNLLLYVTLSQVFRIWVFPFYRADVTLTTVLQLTYDKSSQRYFIASQNDLYQVDQFISEMKETSRAQGTQCLLLANLNVPFCYDKFTTDYILPDGSYGQIASGAFTSADGSTANLLTGDYTSNSTSGNVYSASPADKPNTSTLSIPPQWTSSGVGSAIPITDLAQVFTYTTTVSATTIQATTYPATTIEASTIPASTMGASTIPASTVAASIVSGSTVQPATTISAQTFQASTRQASTVPASSKAASTVEPTTVTAHTTVITSTAVGSTPSGTAAAAAASHTGAANAADVKSAAGMALVGVAAFAIFAL